MENRSGLIVAAALTQATGTAARKAAEEMIVRHSPGARRITLGADKGYDAAAFLADMRALNVTPHIAQNISGRRSAVDGRTTRHAGYAASQRKRKRIKEPSCPILFGEAVDPRTGGWIILPFAEPERHRIRSKISTQETARDIGR
jgi:hypothetical protein